MLIDKAEIERVKQANELVSFIRARGVVLTQRGKQFVGLCPLHPDTEPSLIVDPKKQLWNCLGACHEGGDVYRFVMKADGADFREAHRRLGGHEAESKGVAWKRTLWDDGSPSYDPRGRSPSYPFLPMDSPGFPFRATNPLRPTVRVTVPLRPVLVP